MLYPIVKYGEAVLETEAADVTEFDTPELHEFIESMFESMYAAKGVGLAAPQIGVGRKIAVIDTSNNEDPSARIVLINPRIVRLEGKQQGEAVHAGQDAPVTGIFQQVSLARVQLNRPRPL